MTSEMDNLKKNDSSDQREKDKLIEATNLELKKYFSDSNIVLSNHQNPKKYSEIFHDFIKLPDSEKMIISTKTLKQLFE